MPATVIVGLQWGDEGKGKTTDFLAEGVGMVVRYQGGDNAGHTVVSGDEVLKLHLVPSGVLYPHITSVIASGVVVNPATLIAELDMLAKRGIDVSRVRVSGFEYVTPCSASTCTLWLDPMPRMNRPPDRSSTVAAAIAIVGAVRTKTLVIPVPSPIREVSLAQAASTAN